MLLEHQSSADKNMAFRQLRYAVAALTLLMKHIRQRDMMELLDRLPRVMVEWISPEQVRVLINYMVNAGEAPAPEFMRALAQRLPQHEEN